MALEEYRRKRHFDRTPEPSGKAGAKTKGKAGRFVVQKHDATRLHYDFRLESDGVLKSWAVPKGPSLDPAERRLAVEVEDHPLDYGSFEGIIPKEEYGGGTVVLWDRGRWRPKGDVAEGFRKGHLKFQLEGEKLQGGWNLVRLKGDEAKPNWLLIKENDDTARPLAEGDILEERPESVASGRSLDEIAESPERVWSSKGGKAKPAGKAAAKAGMPKAVKGDAEVAGVRLSHPDRVLYPEQGMTKLDLARYYQEVERWILPHVKKRPLTLVRCPEGRKKACFYQKHFRDGMPTAIRSVPIHEEGGTGEPYLYVDDLAGLVGLVQFGVLELHGWGALIDDVERPDRLVFDLDPDPSVPWMQVIETAELVRGGLSDLGLESFVQTTGGKGLHVVAPLRRGRPWAEVKDFARAFAERLVEIAPDRYVSKASKAARTGKIFIDWLRNARGATAIVPYSSRAREGATVATPLSWKELKRVKPGDFTVATIPARLAKLKKDPWEEFLTTRQTIRAEALRTLGL